jgi:hypothetical protein
MTRIDSRFAVQHPALTKMPAWRSFERSTRNRSCHTDLRAAIKAIPNAASSDRYVGTFREGGVER